MLSKELAQQITAKVLKYSTFPDCAAYMREEELAFLRFANNGVTTSGLTLDRGVFVVSVREGRSGTSQTSDLSDEGLRAAVKRSEELAAISPANPEYMEPLGPQQYRDYDNFDEATGKARSTQMVPHVKSILDAAVAKKLIAAGFFQRSASLAAFANKRGNFGYQRSTDTSLKTTVRNAAGTSSGWAGQPAVKISDINGAELAARAIEKCSRWTKPVRLEPGKYTVVLEPTAAGDLVSYFRNLLSARAADQGQSFLSKKGGGTLIGEKLFPEFITLRSDPFDRRYTTDLWSNTELPSQPVTWIDKGVVKNLSYDRYWASKAGKSPNGAPGNLVLEGMDHSSTDLIKATKHGLLVTRFWYIRSVNMQTGQFTGLTRDGLFLIEDGQVTQPVMNFRFTESVVRLLQNATMLSRNLRTDGAEVGMITPAIQANDFAFTSISDAV